MHDVKSQLKLSVPPFGLCTGTVFLQIGTDQKSVVRRQPVLFFCVINQVRACA